MEKNTCKVIRADASAEACRPWDLPEVGAGGLSGNAARNAGGVMLTAARIEEIQGQARAEAFELGREEGRASGRDEAAAEALRLQSIIATLARPLESLDEQLVGEIGTLALVIARHVIRREISADPGQIMGVIREAAGILPVAARRVRVYLHPDDAALVREAIKLTPDGDDGWTLVEDPALERGGCRVETENSRIDATIEKRLAAIAAEMLGGDRERDHDDGGD